MPKKDVLYDYRGWWVAVVGVLCWFMIASTLVAQSERRSLRVWVDTIDLNVCGDKEFETWAVWLESYTETDTVVGFRLQDSILGCSMLLFWDTSRIRLQPPYVLTPPQTVFGRFPSQRRIPDTLAGTIWLDYSADDKQREVIGTNIPLFYLTGRVRADDTVAPLDGGAKVNFLQLEGVLGDNIGELDFPSGFVRVTRDTTPEYTGRLRTTEGAFDTNRRDTVFVIAGNLFDKRVREFRFSLRADTTKYRFADTVGEGTLAREEWNSKEVVLSDDSIFVRFNEDVEITTQDSVVIGVIVERKTDSAFTGVVQIPEFGINFASCLGKLNTSEAIVTGLKIRIEDTTSTSVGYEQNNDIHKIDVVVGSERIYVDVSDLNIKNILMYNVRGRVVAQWSEFVQDNVIDLPLQRLPGGVYFLVFENEKGKIWYKQVIIQTK